MVNDSHPKHCIDMLRRRKKMIQDDISGVKEVMGTGNDMTSLSDGSEAAALVTGIVQRMKEPYRSAVILRDMEGYSYEEAAEVMKTSVGALRTLIVQGKKEHKGRIGKNLQLWNRRR